MCEEKSIDNFIMKKEFLSFSSLWIQGKVQSF